MYYNKRNARGKITQIMYDQLNLFYSINKLVQEYFSKYIYI